MLTTKARRKISHGVHRGHRGHRDSRIINRGLRRLRGEIRHGLTPILF